MPPDDDKAQIEAMRLMIGGALQQMGRDLENMSKKAKDSSADGSGLKGLDSLITGMTRNLQGPLGLGAAIISVSKSLETFAANRLQMRNFSTDVGASVPLINAMSLAMEKAGITAEESKTSILTLGTTIQDLAARGMGSELATLLRNTGHPVNDIQKLIETSRTNMDKAITDTVQILNRGNEQVRSYRAREVHIAESHLQAMQRTQEEMNKVYQSDLDAAEKWHKGWVERSLEISNTWKWLKDQFMQTFESGAEERQKIIDQYFPAGGKGGADPKNPDWLDRILHPMENKQWPFPGSPSLSNILVPPAGAATSRRSDELIEVERSSNKSLLDIRDSLQRIEGGEGRAGEAGHTGYSTGQARRSLADRLGINAGGATRGDRNNNPGNMKFGSLAQSFGATSADDKGFAVFPNMASGTAAHEALIKSDSYKGLTLDQFGDKYSQGSASWKKTVGSALGIGANDIVNNNDPRLSQAIRKAEGTGGGGSGVPSSVLAEARRVAELGGAGAVQQYIRSKGFHVDSAWCGDFAAAVVSGAGGTPPKGYPVASNWRNWGKPVEGDPQGGDVAIRRGVRTGSTGSHVNIVDRYDPETGTFRAIGGNQSRTIANFSRSRFDFRRGEDNSQAAREQIDKTQSVSQRVDANMNASVDFKNMPSWVKSAVDSNGKFKELRVTRSTPQAGKASSPQGDLQNWSYE